MEYTNTISGLKSKRTEIMQEIDRLRAEAAKLTNDKTAIEQVLISFGDAEFENAPRVYNVTFERGQLHRFICDHLRAKGSATTREVTLAVIASRGKDADDKAFYAKIQQAVSRCLANMGQKGQAVRSGDSRAYEWRLGGVKADKALNL